MEMLMSKVYPVIKRVESEENDTETKKIHIINACYYYGIPTLSA